MKLVRNCTNFQCFFRAFGKWNSRFHGFEGFYS